MSADNEMYSTGIDEANEKGQEVIEIRVSKVRAIIIGIILFFGAFNFCLLWAHLSQLKIRFRLESLDQWMFLVSIVLLIVVHEALHAVAALQWGKVPFNSIRFGVNSKWLVFYCHCDKLLRMRVQRIVLLFPLIVTTLCASLVFWLDPAIWSLLLFSGTISICSGDVMIFLKLQRFGGDDRVQDHPSEPGCYVWPEGQTPLE
ncbi:MAG: DUF3267 domain-containing protein [Candidatus Latescibacteria bacterium]|nr:DUF3267 domain-containing protein [Candidatus Latescibacterota bacterium]